MSAILKAMIICICMNIMMTLVGIGVGGADVISQFLGITNQTVTPTSQFSLTDPNTALPTTISSGTAIGTSTTGTIGFNFIDAIKLVFKFLLLILVCLFLPVYWGFTLSLPLWFTLLLFVETIFGVTATVLALRGIPS